MWLCDLRRHLQGQLGRLALMQAAWLWSGLTTLFLITVSVSASPGDTDSTYRSCVDSCVRHGKKDPDMYRICRPSEIMPDGASVASSHGLLGFLAWACEDECRYHCMWHVTARRASQGLPVLKYHGKWPFRRVMGMQELVSSLFSLANLAAHVAGLALLVRRARATLLPRPHAALPSHARGGDDALAPRESSPTHRQPAGAHPWQDPEGTGVGPGVQDRGDDHDDDDHENCDGDVADGFRTVAMFRDPARARAFLVRYCRWAGLFCAGQVQMWLWSALFHTRDVPITEKLDYFGGNVAQAVTLCVTLVRLLGVGPTPPWAIAGACVAVWVATACHIWYMATVRFDYGWNLLVMIAAGLACSLASTAYAWAVGHPGRVRYAATIALIQLSLVLAALDFPPLWGLLDAHASWHVVTPPLVLSLYAVFATDCEFLWRTRCSRSLRSSDPGHWVGMDDALPVHALAKGKKLS